MSKLLLPYAGPCELTSRYGRRTLNGEEDYHNGIDLCGVDDRRILAPCAGMVGSSAIVTNHADLTWQWGNYVRIDAPDGTQVFLCHMASRAVEIGQRVEAGDLIGVEGNTGYSFGQHCHMEVRRNGIAIDPTPLLGIPNEGVLLERGGETGSCVRRAGIRCKSAADCCNDAAGQHAGRLRP